MDKDRGFKVMAVVALLVAVVSLTIGYANYSSSLTINGQGTVASGWDVHFVGANGSEGGAVGVSASGYAEDAGTAAIDTDTTVISGIDFTFYAPGDSVDYTFKVKNAGKIDAVLDSINLGAFTCTAENDADDDAATTICGQLTAALTGVSESSELASGNTTDTVTLSIEWPTQTDEMAPLNGDINVSMAATTLVYKQK